MGCFGRSCLGSWVVSYRPISKTSLLKQPLPKTQRFTSFYNFPVLLFGRLGLRFIPYQKFLYLPVVTSSLYEARVYSTVHVCRHVYISAKRLIPRHLARCAVRAGKSRVANRSRYGVNWDPRRDSEATTDDCVWHRRRTNCIQVYGSGQAHRQSPH